MPKPPKIPKEVILDAALYILIRDGYASVNIKTIAQELNCSTQPISWHFGNMEKLRTELGKYAYNYTDAKTAPNAEHALDAFRQVGEALTDIAFEEPNLYRFLFLEGNGGYCIGGIEALTQLADNKELILQIASENNLSIDFSAQYLENMIIYTLGILSLCVSGVLRCTKDQVLAKIEHAGDTFLLQEKVNEKQN